MFIGGKMELQPGMTDSDLLERTGFTTPKRNLIFPYIIMTILLVSVILNFVDSSLSASNRFYLCILVLAPTSFVLLNLIPFRCQTCDSVVFYSFDHCCACGEGMGTSSNDKSKINLEKLATEVRKRIFAFWFLCLMLFTIFLFTS